MHAGAQGQQPDEALVQEALRQHKAAWKNTARKSTDPWLRDYDHVPGDLAEGRWILVSKTGCAPAPVPALGAVALPDALRDHRPAQRAPLDAKKKRKLTTQTRSCAADVFGMFGIYKSKLAATAHLDDFRRSLEQPAAGGGSLPLQARAVSPPPSRASIRIEGSSSPPSTPAPSAPSTPAPCTASPCASPTPSAQITVEPAVQKCMDDMLSGLEALSADSTGVGGLCGPELWTGRGTSVLGLKRRAAVAALTQAVAVQLLPIPPDWELHTVGKRGDVQWQQKRRPKRQNTRRWRGMRKMSRRLHMADAQQQQFKKLVRWRQIQMAAITKALKRDEIYTLVAGRAGEVAPEHRADLSTEQTCRITDIARALRYYLQLLNEHGVEHNHSKVLADTAAAPFDIAGKTLREVYYRQWVANEGKFKHDKRGGHARQFILSEEDLKRRARPVDAEKESEQLAKARRKEGLAQWTRDVRARVTDSQPSIHVQ